MKNSITLNIDGVVYVMKVEELAEQFGKQVRKRYGLNEFIGEEALLVFLKEYGNEKSV